jgi:hypothetical protein
LELPLRPISSINKTTAVWASQGQGRIYYGCPKLVFQQTFVGRKGPTLWLGVPDLISTTGGYEMKLPRVLAVLIGILAIACSTATPTPNIDATIEARAKQLVESQTTPNIDATQPQASTPEPTSPAKTTNLTLHLSANPLPLNRLPPTKLPYLRDSDYWIKSYLWQN